ncbi:Modification methylase DpnIIB [Planctomycetes bacterium MalM25]|nr:Modification methylase DpnIIB [Planctomycetes bacterium MalM25]
MGKKKAKAKKTVATLRHEDASRKNIPTAEYESVMRQEEKSAVQVAYERRNRDLDPQLVWRGKDEQDWSDLVVHAPPLYIQEKVQPKVLIDDLLRRTKQSEKSADPQMDLFADFNGLPEEAKSTEFYQHDANWTNRLVLGDSLQVMASLAEREGLRGKVQCIYFDPPYGIKFNSNFQWSTTSRDVKDGKADHITREPEQVKAFRDTWRDGIHSYLTYLRDRLTVARDLLADSGSIFVQIGDENVHRVRAVMDEVFGEDNCCALIPFSKTSGFTPKLLSEVNDYLIWYAKRKDQTKFRRLFTRREPIENPKERYICVETPEGKIIDLSLAQKMGEEPIPSGRLLRLQQATSQGKGVDNSVPVYCEGRPHFPPDTRHWSVTASGMNRAVKAGRGYSVGKTLTWISYRDENAFKVLNNNWSHDLRASGFGDAKRYVVETLPMVVQRCLLMATDPGDLVLDPTCGSGTTAVVAEQWGRRWITIDTSRVALALARARVMGAKFPYYLLADSKEGQQKEAEVTHTEPSTAPTHGNIRHGFVYERVPHITLKSIANNTEIDVIWEQFQEKLEPLREQLNKTLSKKWEEWEIPRESESGWPADAKKVHAAWWKERIARQKEIDASIAAKADYEYLYDKPYEDKKTVRVAGPFTVESLSPHRTLAVDADDELIDPEMTDVETGEDDFVQMILENLRTAGVQQAHKEDKIDFTSITPWPGKYVCAEGTYAEEEGQPEKRAGVFIGPEFGTVSKPDLAAAAREAGNAGFDVLITCAFNYDAHSSEFDQLGRLTVLKARMNADLHMANDLKNTGKGNLFVIFGEPDIDVLEGGTDELSKAVVLREERVASIPAELKVATENLKTEKKNKPKKDDKDEKDAHAARLAGLQERIDALEREAALAERFLERAAVAEPGEVFVQIRGVDVFHPTTGEVRSDGPEGIACWMLDTDYNEESFFVRHAYFLGQNDPYKSLKTTLKAEIDEEAWSTLNSDTSRPFPKPESGRIAVKVINHLGDEVMKVFRVEEEE